MQKKSRSAKVAAARLKLTKPMRVLVDRCVDRKLETKVAYYHADVNEIKSKIDYTSVLRILPQIHQAGQPGHEAVDRDSRVGSQIVAQSFIVKGWLNCTYEAIEPTWSTTLARMFCVSDKQVKTWNTLSGGSFDFTSELLRAGAEAYPYNGTNEHQLMPVNHDRITTHYERQFNFTSDQAITSGFTGALRAKTVYFTIKLKVKNKVLRFAEPTEAYPSNYAPALCVGFTCAEGAATTGSPIYMSYTSMLRYKDA